jgi:NTP pyrophosphatase (non-canonical NTP hydrolase)
LSRDFQELIRKTKEVHKLYIKSDEKRLGKEWDRGEYVKALTADIGMLVKLTMAKDGLREMDNVDAKLKHELSDCLWAIIIIADKYGIDLEQSFLETMEELKKRGKNNELAKSHNS